MGKTGLNDVIHQTKGLIVPLNLPDKVAEESGTESKENEDSDGEGEAGGNIELLNASLFLEGLHDLCWTGGTGLRSVFNISGTMCKMPSMNPLSEWNHVFSVRGLIYVRRRFRAPNEGTYCLHHWSRYVPIFSRNSSILARAFWSAMVTKIKMPRSLEEEF